MTYTCTYIRGIYLVRIVPGIACFAYCKQFSFVFLAYLPRAYPRTLEIRDVTKYEYIYVGNAKLDDRSNRTSSGGVFVCSTSQIFGSVYVAVSYTHLTLPTILLV